MNLVVLLLMVLTLALAVGVWRSYAGRNRTLIQRRSRRGRGKIYFFRGKWENPFFVKIGKTICIERRKGEAQTYISPFGIKVLGIAMVKDPDKAERIIHKKFARERIDPRREWFILSPRLWFFMKSIDDKRLKD